MTEPHEWTEDAEQKYRELQDLWHRALDARSEGRIGLARRLFEIALGRARRKDYAVCNPSDRTRQLHRDLGALLESLGEYREALEHHQQAGEHPAALRCLLALEEDRGARLLVARILDAVDDGSAPEYLVASAVFPALLALREHERLLDLAARERDLKPRQLDILAAACAALESADPGAGLDTRIGGPLRRKILRRFGTWSGVVSAGAKALRLGREQVLRRFAGLRAPLVDPDLGYSEADVTLGLAGAEDAAGDHRASRDAYARFEEKLKPLLERADWSGARSIILQELETAPEHGPTGIGVPLDGWHLEQLCFDVTLLARASLAPLEWAWHRRSTLHWSVHEKSLNLKNVLGMDIDAADALRMWGGEVRQASEVLSRFPGERDALVEERLRKTRESEGVSRLLDLVIQRWGSSHRSRWSSALFSYSGLRDSRWLAAVLKRSWLGAHEDTYYLFGHIGVLAEKDFFVLGASIVGDLEHALRAKLGLPAVGEGWLHQTEMLHRLREAFGPDEVIAEGSPKWLGQQRFDAWIPARKLAVEYQGEQHFWPVAFFGGEPGLRATRERDELKLRLAAEHGVTIEYIIYDEDIAARVREIASRHLDRGRTQARGPGAGRPG